MEICVDNINAALIAYKHGASRLELCSSLKLGGLTPSLGFYKILKEIVTIPIFIMIRPREGNFLYSNEEINVMTEDIRYFSQLKADGFVFGVLDKDNNVDLKNNYNLIKVCENAEVTFHRAFDNIRNNQIDNFKKIASLGFKRLLTSGCQENIIDGLNLIKKLIKLNEPVIIMPGGGINDKNLETILKETGCKEFHGSGVVEKGYLIDLSIDNETYTPDIENVRNMKNIFDKYFDN